MLVVRRHSSNTWYAHHLSISSCPKQAPYAAHSSSHMRAERASPCMLWQARANNPEPQPARPRAPDTAPDARLTEYCYFHRATQLVHAHPHSEPLDSTTPANKEHSPKWY